MVDFRGVGANEKRPRLVRDHNDGTDRDFMAANARKIAGKCSCSWYALAFGTRGSQVQILPLRPSFSHHESVTGNVMGDETALI